MPSSVGSACNTQRECIGSGRNGWGQVDVSRHLQSFRIHSGIPRPASHNPFPPLPPNPRPALTCMSRLRCTTSCMPVSMVMTPATHAAAISPTLWPSTALGTTPRDRHSSASDHSSANCVLFCSLSLHPQLSVFGFGFVFVFVFVLFFHQVGSLLLFNSSSNPYKYAAETAETKGCKTSGVQGGWDGSSHHPIAQWDDPGTCCDKSRKNTAQTH